MKLVSCSNDELAGMQDESGVQDICSNMCQNDPPMDEHTSKDRCWEGIVVGVKLY
jgi:hypothetical protein